MASSGTSAPRGLLARFFDSDVWFSFRRSKVTMVAAGVTAVYFVAALFAPLIAPHDPFDLVNLDVMDSFIPPMWELDGDPRFLLGTDDQGRDMLSAIIHGARVSLFIGFASVVLALVLGVGLGLWAGFVGGRIDAFLMRVAEIQLSFPTILIALLINGVLRGALHIEQQVYLAYVVLVLSIGVSGWVQYARTVRGSTMVERNKEYVQAARVIGIHPWLIMLRHRSGKQKGIIPSKTII
ncbi:MAG: ABC transporter permease, partial [Pseudomonadota bacterium]|nr:ABC transporter permease [Pseudomonadota bacterium]